MPNDYITPCVHMCAKCLLTYSELDLSLLVAITIRDKSGSKAQALYFTNELVWIIKL